jgi:hypothetical protein
VGDIVNITLSDASDDGMLDPYLVLLAPDGSELALNDDSLSNGGPDGLDSSLDEQRLPADGIYTIVASRIDYPRAPDVGEIIVSLELVDRGVIDSNRITYGETIEGTINDQNETLRYTFEGDEGDTVTITLRDTSAKNSLDPLLLLEDEDGNVIAENDDDDSGTLALYDARISTFDLPDDGTYTIVATRAGQNDSGEFALTLDFGDAISVVNVNEPVGSLAIGDTVEGTISALNYQQVWTFEGSEGDQINIYLSGTGDERTLDPYVVLLDPDGAVIAENDDDPNGIRGLDSVIEGVELPVDGTYQIVATRFGFQQGGSFGIYELTIESVGATDGGGNQMPDVAPTEAVEPTEQGSLEIGDTVTGEITNEDYIHLWTFEGTEGTAVTISLIANGEFDTYLALVGPDGEVVAENDDAREPLADMGPLDSQIVDFELPEDGTYTIVATRLGGDNSIGEGEYRLSVETADQAAGGGNLPATPTATPDTAAAAQTIEYGDVVRGEITNETFEELWVFEGQAGDVVTITMRALDGASLDPTLILLRPDGALARENDDAAAAGTNEIGQLDSQIVEYELREDGTYTIVATRFGGSDEVGGEGRYELSLVEGATPDNNGTGGTGSTDLPPTVTQAQLMGEIEIGGAVEGQITNEVFSNAWTFEGIAGQVVTITMQRGADSLDPSLRLLGPEGTIIAESDDVGQNDSGLAAFDAQISAFELPSDGTYTIIAARYGGRNTRGNQGPYTLTLTEGDASTAIVPTTPTTPVVIDTIAYGDSVRGQITDEAFSQLWQFEGQVGQTITITMLRDGRTLDPYLRLIGPDGAVLAENDDARSTGIGALNAQIAEFTLPMDGTYTIDATRYGAEAATNSVGTYTLTLETGDAPVEPATGQLPDVDMRGEIVSGTPVTGEISDMSFAQGWMFDGNEGDIVTITLQRQARTLDPLLQLVGPDGTVLAENDDVSNPVEGLDSTDSQIVEFVLPTTGRYTIVATRFGRTNRGSVGEYTLTLEVAAGGMNAGNVTPPTTTPATAQAIAYGDTVQGEITNAAFEQAWTFEGRTGESVQITMRRSVTTALDPTLRLLGPDGAVLAENDDADARSADMALQDSQINGFVLPTDGTYTIIATRFGGERSMGNIGEYTLTLEAQSTGVSVDNAAPTSEPLRGAQAMGQITLGGEVSATISDDSAVHAWTFEGTAGQTVTITMQAAARDVGLDPYLQLQDADGVLLAENDDSTARGLGPVDSQIVFTLSENGTYTIIAARLGGTAGRGVGEYRLTVASGAEGAFALPTPLAVATAIPTEEAAAATAMPTEEPTVVAAATAVPTEEAAATTTSNRVIAYDSSVQGTISDADFEQRWSFEGRVGDVVTISLMAENRAFDPMLQLIGPDGDIVAENDDAVTPTDAMGALDSQIAMFTVPADGTYTIVASRFGGANSGGTGNYTLTLSTGALAMADSSAPLLYGDRVEGELTLETGFQRWLFDGRAGDIVIIRLTTQDLLQANFSLVNPENVIIRQSLNTSINLNVVETNLTLPTDGTYAIIVTPVDNIITAGMVGMYTLDLQGTSPDEFTRAMGAIAYGETVEGEITQTTWRQAWTFEGQASEIVSITMIDTSAEDTLDPLVLLTDAEGNIIASNDDDSGSDDLAPFDSRINAFILPTSGTYTIIATRATTVRANARTFGTYSLTLLLGDARSTAMLVPTAAPTLTANAPLTGVIQPISPTVAPTAGYGAGVVMQDVTVVTTGDVDLQATLRTTEQRHMWRYQARTTNILLDLRTAGLVVTVLAGRNVVARVETALQPTVIALPAAGEYFIVVAPASALTADTAYTVVLREQP